jgi:hypothetical protein
MAVEKRDIKSIDTMELQALAFIERENIDFRTMNLNTIRAELSLREQQAGNNLKIVPGPTSTSVPEKTTE